MSETPWSSETLLTASSQVEQFQCGVESVDNWIRHRATKASPHVKTVLFLDQGGRPIAFMATRMIQVNVRDASSAQRAGSDRDGRSTGFLLAQMGVQREYQHAQESPAARGVGKAVLRAAMCAAVRAHQEAPFQLFVVDAENPGLVAYYEKFGLRPLFNTLRLLAPMSKINHLITGK